MISLQQKTVSKQKDLLEKINVCSPFEDAVKDGTGDTAGGHGGLLAGLALGHPLGSDLDPGLAEGLEQGLGVDGKSGSGLSRE